MHTHLHKIEVQFVNESDKSVVVSRLDAAVVLPVGREDKGSGQAKAKVVKIRYFRSDWGMEFTPHEKDLICLSGADPANLTEPFRIEVTAGRSSKGFIPWVGIETGDKCWGMALAWSGNWLFEAADDPKNGGVRVSMGISGEGFETVVGPGEEFVSAAVYLSEGDTPEEAALEMRRFFREELSLLRFGVPGKEPVEYNGWWPYEDSLIDEMVFAENARIAKELGFTYAVMDAGWFGPDDADKSWYDKRGDWTVVNRSRFPSGMKALCDNVKRIGLLPGLWCEIEAVGGSADLAVEQPEIIAMRDGKSLGYVCFGSAEGLDWALGVVDGILGGYGAKWIKFDFNLDPGGGCDRTEHGHGRGDGLVAHYRNYYHFLEIVRERYPDVVIENCSSGGLRLDIEMLSHTHWTHLSDPDHTELHLQCFWGALSYLHQSACLHFSWSEVMGGHNLGVIRPVIDGMSRERFDWMIRAVLMGIPGFSYKLPDFPEWCRVRLKEHCEFYRGIFEDFVLNGDIYRLTGQPLSGGGGERFPVFELCSRGTGRDRSRADVIIWAFCLSGSPSKQRVRLFGLDPDAVYFVEWLDSGERLEALGSRLMSEGLTIAGAGEFTSQVGVCKWGRSLFEGQGGSNKDRPHLPE